MKSKYKSLFSNTFIFALGTFGSKAISFFLVPLYTNVLSTAEYGLADLITTISFLLLPLFSLSLGESILYFGVKAENVDKREAYFKNGFSVVIVGCISLAFISPLFLFYHALDGYTFFLPAYSILEIVRTYIKYYTKARGKNLIYSVDSIIYAFFVALLNIVFLLFFKWGVAGYILAYLISEFVSILFLSIYNKTLFVLRSAKLNYVIVKSMILFSAPLILNSISWGISNSSDKIMLDSIVSPDSVGIYSVAAKLPTIVNTVVNLFCQAWTISAYLEVEKRDKEFYTKVFSLFSFVLVFISSVVILVERPFMYLFVGAEFSVSSRYVPILLIATVYQNYAAFFGAIIQSGKKNNFMLISTLVAALINLVLNYILINKFSIMGACIATAFSFLVVFVLRMLFSNIVIRFSKKYWKLCISNVVLLIQAVFVSLNIHSFFISIIVVVFIFIFNLDCLSFLIDRRKFKEIKNISIDGTDKN